MSGSAHTSDARGAAWPATEAEARAVQEQLRPRVELADRAPAPGTPGTVLAGVDVAYDDTHDVVAAAAVALDGGTHEVVARATAYARVPFPYVPGLLAFRELPAVLDALERLGRVPDLVVCDGYGLAHPRRFGLASHLGVLTGLATVGVAKTPFVFRHGPVGAARGDSAPLLDGTEEVGRALRTREGVRPVFVSVGHRVSLDSACAHTLSLARRYRLPETTRRADALCREALREAATRQTGESRSPGEEGRAAATGRP
ncbi:endonuclease V [Streptomyces armeniacus]|uniref:Endonuclease V n=1 Tax=Streptomyces armeniacus TaxID=83291 RepID=A0A345XLP9_9ACTN|nr:endonuclease V [Streptomyces armeniacus]AXK32565.1 endonuclease V [Streptomyces armeniacus]